MNPNHCHSRARIPLGEPMATAAYHVTIRTLGPTGVLGHLENGAVRLSRIGALAERCWHEIPAHCAGVVLDAITVAPDRVEGLLLIPARAGEGLTRALAVVIGSFKSTVSERLGRSIWSAGYQASPLRSRKDLEQTRRAILGEPLSAVIQPEAAR